MPVFALLPRPRLFFTVLLRYSLTGEDSLDRTFESGRGGYQSYAMVYGVIPGVSPKALTNESLVRFGPADVVALER